MTATTPQPAPCRVTDRDELTVAQLRRMVDAGLVRCLFQPVVTLRGKSIIGVEALARGTHPDTGRMVPPDRMFDLAQGDDDLLIDLDRLCRRRALEGYRHGGLMAAGLIVSINFEASLLDRGVGGSGHIQGLAAELGIKPRKICIEIVESKVRALDALNAFVDTHRGAGFLVALDDLGAGHSNLERVAQLKPDVIKIDRGLITGMDGEFYKQEVTRSLCSLAQKIGALTVGEGVESESEALCALELGVDLLQGYHFARPGPPDPEGLGPVEERIASAARAYRDFTVNAIARRKAQHARYEQVVRQLFKELSRVSQDRFDELLGQLIALHPALECIYVLDPEGRQISRTVCAAGKLVNQRKRLFQPSARGSDQSMKDYYLLLTAGLNRYVSSPYISLASGNLCITISTWFRSAQGWPFILCADFDAELFECLA